MSASVRASLPRARTRESRARGAGRGGRLSVSVKRSPALEALALGLDDVFRVRELGLALGRSRARAPSGAPAEPRRRAPWTSPTPCGRRASRGGAARPRGRQARPRGGRGRPGRRSSRGSPARARGAALEPFRVEAQAIRLARSSASRSSSASSCLDARVLLGQLTLAGGESLLPLRALLAQSGLAHSTSAPRTSPPPSSPSSRLATACSRRTSSVSCEFSAWACLAGSRRASRAGGRRRGARGACPRPARCSPVKASVAVGLVELGEPLRSSRKVCSCSVSAPRGARLLLAEATSRHGDRARPSAP